MAVVVHGSARFMLEAPTSSSSPTAMSAAILSGTAEAMVARRQEHQPICLFVYIPPNSRRPKVF
jgi:hypothetical protein